MWITSVVLLLSLQFTEQSNYTQYNSYEQSDCSGQPHTIRVDLGGACTIPGTPESRCTDTEDARSVYASQKLVCSNEPLNLKGIVQDYVAKFVWTSSPDCKGNPQSVEAVVADANCHLFQKTSGKETLYISVNCNGGRPIFTTCKDSGCNDCVAEQYSGECMSLGASSSLKAKCIRATGSSVSGGGGYNIDYDDSAASVFNFVDVLALIFVIASYFYM